MSCIYKQLLFSVLLGLMTVSLLGIEYEVSYSYSATPVLGIRESTSTINFYYPFIDEALASPTQVGTAVIIINKQPTYDQGPVKFVMYMEDTYFDLYAKHLGRYMTWNIDWIGSVKDPRYRLKGDKYNLGGFTIVGMFHYWVSEKKGNEHVITIIDTNGILKKILDLSKPFKVVFDIEYQLDHLDMEMIVIPKTHVEVSYTPKK